MRRCPPAVILILMLTAACNSKPGQAPNSTPENESAEGMPRRTIETLPTQAGPAGQPASEGPLWPVLDQDTASRLVKLSIECAQKEYPNKPGHVLENDQNLLAPKDATPAFYGCFDWHSAVHGHWTMATLLRLFPKMPETQALVSILDQHLTPERIAKEKAFLDLPRSATWERPYGWGWLLRLQAELATPCAPDEPCLRQKWSQALKPLSASIRDKLITYLNRLSVPIRDGTHANTAFSLVHAWHYAMAMNDQELASVISARSLHFYHKDRNCPAHFEPSGEDFLSACLGEAQLMALLLPQSQFVPWLDAFLPAVDSEAFAPLRTPALVLDAKDPRIGHLIGLSFHRAAAYQGISKALAHDPRAQRFQQLAALHLVDGQKRIIESGYGGAHWLASFNLLAYLTQLETAPGVAPAK